MTTGATGGTTTNKQQTDREEARGVERDAHTGKLHCKARSSDGGVSEGGERGGPEPSGGQENIAHKPK